MFQSLIGRQKKYIKTTPSNQSVEVPEGIYTKCPKCNKSIYVEDLIKNIGVCIHCESNLTVSPNTRIKHLVDTDSFQEMDREMSSVNPLDFEGYEKKLENYKEKTKQSEAVVTGVARIDDNEVVLAIMDSRFMMGSMGSVVGEKITRAIEYATRNRLPIVIFCASGGARMQEGIFSLMQMAKTSSALARHDEAGLLYVSVLTHPTTGGVTASFAMLGDIIVAEPGALIGFAGPRVIEQTINQKLPQGFQRSEFLLEHGMIDCIISRAMMREELSRILRLHKTGQGGL